MTKGTVRAARRSKKTPIPSQKTSPPRSRYLFFGGKGGVGKTTAAAASALRLLDGAAPDALILLFSTDPAHSLSDSLEVKIGDRLVTVARKGRARLVAYEMDARVALEKFKAAHRATLGEIATRGTLLDESDVNQFLNLSLPGMDEVMALFELSELDRSGRYAHIVVDTAPSGHTSRLLRLPELFSHMLRALDRMADKHRYIVAQFARGRRARADEVDLFLSDLAERIERVRAMLYDPGQTSFTLVTIPETMSVQETVRYFRLLQEEKIPVTDLIVNRVEQEHGECAYCRARAAGQRPSLKEIAREFKSLTIHHVPLMSDEVRGHEALRRFARAVWEENRKQKVEGRRQKAEGSRRKTEAGDEQSQLSTVHCPLPTDLRLLLFGGKGGVGKTTAAAAAGLALAQLDARARVLVFSIDPAHSLSDSFGEEVGELRRGVAGRENLDAMEINPVARFEELKNRYRAWTDDLFAKLTGDSRWEIQFDREAMRELVSLAPPGIDEIAALGAISELVDQNRYATIVVDTAPTGHLVRFLELPEVVLSWVRAFIKLLLKYQGIVRASGVAEELIALSKSIKRIIALLADARACEFVGVAIPERMSLRETERLTSALERLKVPMRRLLVNAVVPPAASDDCGFCSARRCVQRRVLEDFRRKFGSKITLLVAPERAHEIRGPVKLLEHFNDWRPLDSIPRIRSSTGRARVKAARR
ncbi:MAG TPA: ArsA family ATPase [Pyrinomonadaceae bacterium]